LSQDPSAAWAQLDPNQWTSAYYGYGYDAYTYGATQDPSAYAYGAYGAYGQYPQQASTYNLGLSFLQTHIDLQNFQRLILFTKHIKQQRTVTFM
jgi:hypothetical protein